MRLVPAVFVALCLAAAPAFAQASDLPEPLAQALAATYDPERDMKDLSVTIRQTFTQTGEQPQVIEGAYYYKAPDRTKVAPKQVPEGLEGLVAYGAMQSPVRVVGQMLAVPPGLKGQLDWTETVQGKQRRYVGKLRAPSSGELVYQLDAEGRIVEKTNTVKGRTLLTLKLDHLKKDGKRLVKSYVLDEQGEVTKVAFEYVSVGKHLLVKKAVLEVPEATCAIEFTNHKVDKGVDDAVFEGK